ARLPQVPGQRSLCGEDHGECAGPQRVGEVLDIVGEVRRQGQQHGVVADQDGRRGVAAAALRLEQGGDGVGGEGVRPDAVDGVRGQDDQATAAGGVDGGGEGGL